MNLNLFLINECLMTKESLCIKYNIHTYYVLIIHGLYYNITFSDVLV